MIAGMVPATHVTIDPRRRPTGQQRRREQQVVTTAEATRTTDPARKSPTAKMPDQEVANGESRKPQSSVSRSAMSAADRVQ